MSEVPAEPPHQNLKSTLLHPSDAAAASAEHAQADTDAGLNPKQMLESSIWTITIIVYAILGGLIAWTFAYEGWGRWAGMAAMVLGSMLIAAMMLAIPQLRKERQIAGHPIASLVGTAVLLILILIAVRWGVSAIESRTVARVILFAATLASVRVLGARAFAVLLLALAGAAGFHVAVHYSDIRQSGAGVVETSREFLSTLASNEHMRNLLPQPKAADDWLAGYSRLIDPRHEQVNDRAVRLCRGLNNEPAAKTQAILTFVANEIEYISDPRGWRDYPRRPRKTLELEAGDCEDQAILVASMLEGVGVHAYLGFVQQHAFAMVDLEGDAPAGVRPIGFVDGKPLYLLEATRRNARIGDGDATRKLLYVIDARSGERVDFTAAPITDVPNPVEKLHRDAIEAMKRNRNSMPVEALGR